MVTELGTGLGMLGGDDLDEVLESRSTVMRSLSPENWDQLRSVRAGGAYDTEFHSAWLNGRTFLEAREGLRQRRPELVEWKGVVRASGDEVAPIDLRIDHVYLVSCKYMSNILFNVSPTHIFDSVLAGGSARRGRGAGGDWYAEVAPAEYQRLYDVVRGALRSDGPGPPPSAVPRVPHDADGLGLLALPGLERTDPGHRPTFDVVSRHSETALRDLPPRAVDLTSAHRSALGERLKSGWPNDAKAAYRELSDEVARASVSRWHAALSVGANAGEAMLWRLLRMGSAPYFVLGSSAARSLRLRIATPWDWKQLFRLVRLEVFPQPGGQPRVGWLATVRERASGQLQEVSGHVEVRWSHGRFGGLPEAKGYLDTRHHLVPGYFPLQ
jgi:hypothetical protein